jgi:hypothetical protein
MTHTALIALALLLSGCTAWPEVDAQRCASYRHMTELLNRQYGEQIVARGLGPAGIIELYTTAESFTITQVLPTGISCVVAMGSKWREVHRPVREIPL